MNHVFFVKALTKNQTQAHPRQMVLTASNFAEKKFASPLWIIS